MAIDSDIQGADARLAVQFYKKSVKQEDASIEAGRPIFKEFDFFVFQAFSLHDILSYTPLFLLFLQV